MSKKETYPDKTQENIEKITRQIATLEKEISQVIIGQHSLIQRLIVGLIANGHILLEGVPGLAKTLSIRTLAQAVNAHFQRIQFTPDLLPADIVGTLIYNPHEGEFKTKKGPVFANFVLADEINRAPAKVQSALLEAMQEKQVTIGETTYPLPSPFLVLATQNPVDQEGVYPLPEAQVDRFMLKVELGYPSKEEEKNILNRMATTDIDLEINAVMNLETISEARKAVDSVYVDEKIKHYIVEIVYATREPEQANVPIKEFIQFGASPRASIALTLASKAWALLQGRNFVIPQDIKDIGADVLRHRVIVSYEAEAENINSDVLIKKFLIPLQFLKFSKILWVK